MRGKVTMANEKSTRVKYKKSLAINQDILAKERTKLSITRTELAFYNSKMSLNRTHLSYLRTIVSLIVAAATLYKALPAIGVSYKFSTLIAAFIFVFAGYFIYKDATVYPKMKQEIDEMEQKVIQLQNETREKIYDVEINKKVEKTRKTEKTEKIDKLDKTEESEDSGKVEELEKVEDSEN